MLSLSSLASRVVLARHLDTRELPLHLHREMEDYRRLEGAFTIREVDVEVARLGQGEVSREEREEAWRLYLRSNLGKMMSEFEVVKRVTENSWSVNWPGGHKSTTVHLKNPVNIVHDNSIKKFNFGTQNYMKTQFKSYLENGKVVLVSKTEEHQRQVLPETFIEEKNTQVGMAVVNDEKTIFAIDESEWLRWSKRIEKPVLDLAYTYTIRGPRAKTRGDREVFYKYVERWRSASQNEEV